MEDGEGAALLKLPPEIRLLADFLYADERPGALLNEKAEVVWQDEDFEALELTTKTVGALVHELELDGRARDKIQEAVAGRRHWRRTRLRNGWTALVSREAAPSRGSSTEREQSGSITGAVTTLSKTPAPTDASTTTEHGCFDWTQFPVDGLSDWIQRVKEHDWGSTPVGPMDAWPQELRQAVLRIMNNPKPRILLWGKDTATFIHNEASAPLFGKKHPDCLGKDASVVFAELWSEIKAAIASVYSSGNTFTAKKMLLPMDRHDFIENTYWDFSLLPVLAQDGTVVGLVDELYESTQAIRGQRRRQAIVKLSEAIAPARTLQELWPNLLKGCEHAVDDVPFAELYSIEDDDTAESVKSASSNSVPKRAVCQGTVRLPDGCATVARSFKIEDDDSHPGILKSCVQAWREGRQVMLTLKDGTLPLELANSQGTDKRSQVRTALVKPLRSLTGGSGQNVIAILIIGLCCKCPFDEEYSLWTHFLGELSEKAATLISLPEEQRRAQQIADEINDALTQQLRTTTLEAEKSEARFKRMAESSPTGIFRFDADGRPLHVNDAYLEIVGDTQDESTKRRAIAVETLSDRIHPEDLDRFIGAWTSVREDKNPVTVEYRLRRPWKSVDKATGQELNGETWLLANAFPDIEPDGTVSSVSGWLTDISHRKFTEGLAAQRLEEALENKRQTENFIDMTSHEMRNPLSAILQSADSIVSSLQAEMTILSDTVNMSQETADEILDASQTIILCAQHQKRITDDILTLSKLDASLLVISPDTVQPPILVSKALKMYEGEIGRGGIDAKMCVEPSYKDLAVDWVVLDSSRFLQVVINLLTNAIKFTQYAEKREIRICLGASKEKPTGNHHKVKFIDPRPARPVHNERPEWGNGEDLYIQVAVSDTGRGLSEEEMKLLFQRFQQASPKTYKQYGGSGLGLFISRELCELQGGQIGVCSCQGKTVFTFYVKAKRHQSSAPRRPSMASWSSTSAAPTVHDGRGSTILVDARNGGHDSHQADGSIDSAERPDVKASVESKTVVEPVKSPLSPAITPSIPDKLHVLVVEDNAINQKIMAQQLRKAGCTVHVANHGLECLNFLDESVFCGAATALNIVLLDLEMPTMDGLTCIRHIREYQRTGKIGRHVPVIAVTANARSEQISVALGAGMDNVVTKPFRIPELMPQMRRLVEEVAKRELEGG